MTGAKLEKEEDVEEEEEEEEEEVVVYRWRAGGGLATWRWCAGEVLRPTRVYW